MIQGGLAGPGTPPRPSRPRALTAAKGSARASDRGQAKTTGHEGQGRKQGAWPVFCEPSQGRRRRGRAGREGKEKGWGLCGKWTMNDGDPFLFFSFFFGVLAFWCWFWAPSDQNSMASKSVNFTDFPMHTLHADCRPGREAPTVHVDARVEHRAAEDGQSIYSVPPDRSRPCAHPGTVAVLI